MNKEVTKENISPEAVRALDFAKVMAIAFAEVGAQVLRTDELGTIVMVSDGEEIRVK